MAKMNFHTINIKSKRGKQVLNQPNNGYTAIVDISEFAKGAYLVTIVTENQKYKLCLFKE